MRPKANGEKRLILNLKSLNKYIITKHFKLEDHRTVAGLINGNCFMCTIDMKDAYFLISVYKPHRKYLRFEFMEQIYQYSCMPFGRNCAPLVFTKLMKPIIANLRSKNYKSVLYLDDFLLLGDSYSKCLENTKVTIKLLEELGFIINYNKSCIIPKQKIVYLGFPYDSTDMSISLSPEKRIKIIKLLNKFSINSSFENKEADAESRTLSKETEWSLCNEAYRKIIAEFRHFRI